MHLLYRWLSIFLLDKRILELTEALNFNVLIPIYKLPKMHPYFAGNFEAIFEQLGMQSWQEMN